MFKKGFTPTPQRALASSSKSGVGNRLVWGFTLIELLVVISIIGFLATIILISVQSSRAQSRDASIKTSLHQLRNAAEMNYTKTKTYAQVCNESDDTLRNSGEFKLLEEAIERENGGQDVRCFEGPGKTSFAASSPLVAQQGKHWCVESAGFSIELGHEITSARCE